MEVHVNDETLKANGSGKYADTRYKVMNETKEEAMILTESLLFMISARFAIQSKNKISFYSE